MCSSRWSCLNFPISLIVFYPVFYFPHRWQSRYKWNGVKNSENWNTEKGRRHGILEKMRVIVSPPTGEGQSLRKLFIIKQIIYWKLFIHSGVNKWLLIFFVINHYSVVMVIWGVILGDWSVYSDIFFFSWQGISIKANLLVIVIFNFLFYFIWSLRYLSN